MQTRFLVIALLLLATTLFNAQLSYPSGTALFDNIHDFRSDSTLVALVKKHKVKSISQVVSTPNYTFTYGEFKYDEKGKVIYILTQGGKTGYEYDGDVLVKLTRFNNKDSAESWQKYTYDDKNRLLKTELIYYQQGKLINYVEKESKLISEEKDKSRWQITKYGFEDIYTISYSLDSSANNLHYYIEYEYRPKDVDEKGRKRGNKELTRSYTKNNCKYEDMIKYKVYGRLETPHDIKTYYYQGDDKGRLIEYGEVDYGPAIEQFMSEHPEEFSYGTISPKFIKAVLNGELKTDRRLKIKQVYDAKGRLIEKVHYGTRYTFKYSAKGQLAEQIKQGTQPTKDELFYNEKGLITRVRTTGYTTDSGNKTVVLEESNFTYTYY
jgi:YD repeat-containing protein